MQVLLKKEVPGLGHEADVVTVRDGYGVNYLIPQGYAEPITAKNRKAVLHNAAQRLHKVAEKKKEAQALSAKLERLPLTIEMRLGEKGKIYGSVTAQQLADKLQSHGMQVLPSQISLPHPVKAAGEHTAFVTLHKEVKAQLKFTVTSAEA